MAIKVGSTNVNVMSYIFFAMALLAFALRHLGQEVDPDLGAMSLLIGILGHTIAGCLRDTEKRLAALEKKAA